MSYKSSGKPNQTDEKTNSEHLNKSPNALKDQGDTPSFMQRIIMGTSLASKRALKNKKIASKKENCLTKDIPKKTMGA